MNKSLLSAAAFVLLSSPALAGGSAGGAVGASGQVMAATPAAVAAILRESGYKVTMNPTNPDEDPSMSVKAGDYTIDVWLGGCKNGTACSRVAASTSWDYSDSKDKQKPDVVNEWNSNYYSQAYIYEDAYYLDSNLFIKGGYTKNTLKAWFSDYLGDIAEFENNLP